MSAKQLRREFLQLSHVFDADKHDPVGMMMSEKLDGQRCLWVPQSRGIATVNVPWANLDKKVRPIATGLWSRYGNVIEGPSWFLDALPKDVILDGELTAGRKQFQLTRKIISRDVPDDRWTQIKYAVYGSPDLAAICLQGEIKDKNFHRVIDEVACRKFFESHDIEWDAGFDFDQEYTHIKRVLEDNDVAYALPQQLCMSSHHLHTFHKEMSELDAEGVILRDPKSRYYPKRMHHSLKVKERFDDEATIVGFVSGRKGKKGLVLGKLGALIVEWKGVRFELGSGLSMADRELDPFEVHQWACENPEKELPVSDTGNVIGQRFKIGDKVTFSYRELSDKGIPKEACYVRVWEAI